MPEHPEGNRNLYALSKNSSIYSNNVTNFTQNVSTGEISFKVAGRDPYFGFQANKDEAVGTIRGVKIPVKAGKGIAVWLTNPLFIKNYVSYFGDDDRAVKNFKAYQTNKFVIQADELEGVSYVTFRFGLVKDTQEVGSVHSTKIKVEYGTVHTDWSPAPEDSGWATTTLVPTQEQRYLWKFDYIYYSDDSVEIAEPVNLSIAGDKGDTGNGIANTVITYGLSVSDTTEPATWSSDRPTLVKGMYLWTRTVIIYTNGESTTSYQISYIAKDADATAAIDKTKQELLEKLDTVRNDSLAAAEEAKQGLINVNTKVDNAKAEIDKAKQDLTNVASELNTAKQDLSDSVSAVNTKVESTKAELTQTKQQLTTVADDLSKAKTDLQNAVSTVDTKATNLQSDLSKAKQDLTSQAQQLQAQASAQSELTKRVSSVEKTADGTKTTVSELSKTVAQNGKDITSVTARTKVVEDDLAGTKTTLSQVKTTADSTSQKTATLETGLNGLSARFNSLSVGNKNYLPASRVVNRGCSNFSYSNTTKSWTMTAPASSSGFGNGIKFNTADLNILLNGGETLFFGLMIKANKACSFNYDVNNALSGTTSNDNDDTSKRAHSPSNKSIPANVWTKVWFSYTAKANVAITENNSSFGIVKNTEPVTIEIKEVMVAKSNVPVDYQTPDADVEQKIAEYKQNADQNYASLQTTVQNLDGTVQHNKTVADQTAQGFTTRIESLETYKDGESERANAYFESAKTETAKQLTAERTAIANNYVAKSTYTSDVTGIRNELSATTSTANATKTNLANYQASNDKMVASLKSSLQTTDGNVSNLQTKVEAVPGQITSAVSAVEGKIPTSSGGRNLAQGTSKDWSEPFTKFKGIENTTIGLYRVLTDGLSVGDTLKTRIVLEYTDITPASGKTAEIRLQGSGDVTNWSSGCYNSSTFKTISGSGELVFEHEFKITANHLKNSYWSLAFRTNWIASGSIQWKLAKVERGMFFTDWSPAPEDTAEQISNLSSEIQQTADGMTLLATKTELNSAKNELQSGINTATSKANAAQSASNSNAQTISTHTTQISALNTGLQAKVSQSDFNTLSGRVTTAENNITAKANELSSKITKVEGKIPTSIGARNYIRNYGLTATGWAQSISGWSFEIIKDSTAKSGQYLKATCTKAGRNGFFKNLFDFSDGRFFGKKMTWAMDVKLSKTKSVRIGPEWGLAYLDFNATTEWKRYSKTFTVATTSGYNNWVFYTNDNVWNVGDIVYIRDVQLEDGSIATSPVPAVEDTESDIKSISSELKQTADGMTMLATKTELNTAKSELQSGISTATNKANNAQSTADNAQSTANSAQNTANNNAQTISTHTTQISALNTGLQAKVSQSDFNTLSGRVTSAENNITAKANELSSKITSVEGKIPTEIGTVNLLKNSKAFKGSNITGSSTILNETYQGCVVRYFKNTNPNSNYQDYAQFLSCVIPKSEGEYVVSFWAKGSGTTRVFFYIGLAVDSFVTSQGASGNPVDGRATFTLSENWERYWVKYKLQATTEQQTVAKNLLFRHDSNSVEDETYLAGVQLEEGNVVSCYAPAPEDTASEISSLSSELKQTADGITLLASKTELNNAKNELQSGINTATNKANAAQNTANSNAQTISTHTTQISALNTGLQAKVSQSEFNTLSGRVTTAENNITAKANELSSKISSVEGKLPSGEMNLVEYGRPADGYSPYAGAEYTTHGFYYNGAYKMYIIKNSTTSEKTLSLNRFKVERNTEYTLYFKGFNNWEITNMDVWFLKRVSESRNDFDSAQQLVIGRKLSNGAAENISVTFNTGNYDEGYLRFDNNGTTTAGTRADLYFGDVSVKKGKTNNGWSPSLAELASSQDLKTAQSEIKQTTDSITASVSSVQTAASNAQSTANTAVSKADAAQAGVNTLDSTTVKSASLTINTDGIVMKAGKSTTDVANAIGSYFAVNQNAINLFSDKINVKGNMIVDGAITGTKIAANSISSDKIVASGITANVIKGGVLQSVNGSTNFELNTGKLFYNNNNTGVFRVQNGASTMGLKFSNTPITVNGTSRILSRAILGGDRNETTLDDGKWDKGGFSGLVIETIKGAIPAVNEHADSLRAISDTIYFTHTYSADSPTGVTAHGWKMETYAPDSSISGNIVLKPYGINYRQSDIVVGDIRLDNGDGSGYWMRATINTLKACFGHILNGGVSSSALNAIRSELDKISGT